jgi:hypothetical protein
MSRISTRISVFILVAAITASISPNVRAQDILDNAAIQKILTDYNEPGYKFLEKIDAGMWKVLYARPGWDFGWEVVVTATSEQPEAALLVIGTTLMSSETMNGAFLMQLLDENSYDTNPGSYSIFYQDGLYFVQYAVKMPQSMITEPVLKEAIGFVAGYSNSRIKELEGLLDSNSSSSKPSSDAAKPADGAKKPANGSSKPSISFKSSSDSSDAPNPAPTGDDTEE